MSKQTIKSTTTKQETVLPLKTDTKTEEIDRDIAVGDVIEITQLWANAPKSISIGYRITLPMAFIHVKGTQLILKTGHYPKATNKSISSIYETLEIPLSCLRVVTKANRKHSTVVTTYSSTSTKKKTKVNYDKLTDNQKYFADLVMAETRKEVIELALEGVDIDQFDFYMDRNDDAHEYFVMVPKNAKGVMPMLMAHTDIHPNITAPTKDTLYFEDGVFSGEKGLGADDRAGVYTINQVLRKYPDKFIVGFFDKEEIGCVGSTKFTNSPDFKTINKMVSCYISIDRRRAPNGGKTIAIYGEDNDELFKLIKDNLNRDTVRGSVTDCAKLARKSAEIKEPVACFNFSCGYENEHRASETLHWKELEETVKDAKALVTIKELWKKQFTFEEKPWYGSGSYYRGGTYPQSRSTKTKTKGGSKSSSKHSNYYYGTDGWGMDDFIMVGKEALDEMDAAMMLDLLRYYTGSDVKIKNIASLHALLIPGAGEEVILKPTVVVGQKNSGRVLSSALMKELQVGTWIVERIDDETLLLDLVSEDGKVSAYNVPCQWFDIVDESTTYVAYN